MFATWTEQSIERHHPLGLAWLRAGKNLIRLGSFSRSLGFLIRSLPASLAAELGAAPSSPCIDLPPPLPAGLAAELGRLAPDRSRPPGSASLAAASPAPRLHQEGCRRKPAYRVSLKPSCCGRKPRCGAVAVSVTLLSPPE